MSITGSIIPRPNNRMGVVSKSEVPDFGPPLNQTVVFRKDDDYRNFLFAKRNSILIMTHPSVKRRKSFLSCTHFGQQTFANSYRYAQGHLSNFWCILD